MQEKSVCFACSACVTRGCIVPAAAVALSRVLSGTVMLVSHTALRRRPRQPLAQFSRIDKGFREMGER